MFVTVDGGGEFTQAGSADVRIETASILDGRIGVGPGPPDEPDAASMAFPSFSRNAEDYPRAALRVTNAASDDEFNPGNSSFSFGADFKLSGRSWDDRGADNGDNLIQRGLSSDPAMFKAELDLRRPACTVRGASGTVTARTAEPVESGHWYQMRCRRSGDTLTVQVTDLERTGEDRAISRMVVGRIGDVSFATAAVPISVGGKLAHDGSLIRSETDQFNGLIMHPTIILGP